MAVETNGNARVTVTATQVVSLCWLWSVRCCFLSAGSLLCCRCLQLLLTSLQLLLKRASPAGAVGCEILPGVYVDVQHLRVSPAHIFTTAVYITIWTRNCKTSYKYMYLIHNKIITILYLCQWWPCVILIRYNAQPSLARIKYGLYEFKEIFT